MEMKIKHKDKILFKALAALVVGILVISIATWLLGAFRDAKHFVPVDFQLKLPSFQWQEVSFIPQQAYSEPNIPKEWVHLIGYVKIPDENRTSPTDIYFNMDNGAIATTAPKPLTNAIVEVQMDNQWVIVENYLDTQDSFSGKIRVMDKVTQSEIKSFDLVTSGWPSENDSRVEFGLDANGYLSIRSPEVRFFINYITGETVRLPVEFQDYKSEMIADDGSRVVAGLYTDKTNLLVWDRLSEKIYTIEEPSARAAAVTSPNLDYLAYSVTNKKEQMQILNVATADSTVFWETDERIRDFEWINNTMIGCTTYSSGLIFPLSSITEKHNYSIVLCDLEDNLVANRKIPLTIPKTRSVFFDSTGHYAYYLSGSNFHRVTLR